MNTNCHSLFSNQICWWTHEIFYNDLGIDFWELRGNLDHEKRKAERNYENAKEMVSITLIGGSSKRNKYRFTAVVAFKNLKLTKMTENQQCVITLVE